MNNGPVSSYYAVYDDFFNYDSGIYYYVFGNLLGYHAIKITGWGV